MRIPYIILSFLTFVVAAAGSLVAGWFAVGAIERFSEISVREVLDSGELEWAEVSADGLRVLLAGTAPDEAARFAALSATGSVVEASRVIDQMDVAPSKALAPPSFSAEILRNASGISIIGLLPTKQNMAQLESDLAKIAGEDGFSSLI